MRESSVLTGEAMAANTEFRLIYLNCSAISFVFAFLHAWKQEFARVFPVILCSNTNGYCNPAGRTECAVTVLLVTL